MAYFSCVFFQFCLLEVCSNSNVPHQLMVLPAPEGHNVMFPAPPKEDHHGCSVHVSNTEEGLRSLLYCLFCPRGWSLVPGCIPVPRLEEGQKNNCLQGCSSSCSVPEERFTMLLLISGVVFWDKLHL